MNSSEAGTRLRAVIDGYDVAEEKGRYRFPDVEVAGVKLNRGTAQVALTGDPQDAAAERARQAQRAHTFTTTHAADGPVIELGYPTAGQFVSSRNGVYLDMYLGVAQKLLDENHPKLLAAVDRLVKLRLATRREILTDDFFAVRDGVEGVITTGMLADRLARLAAEAFPRREDYRVFFSNSGTEANEAAIKLAQRVRFKRIEEKYGRPAVEQLMAQLGIGKVEFFEKRPGSEPVYADYPMWTVACEGSFHGRTLGALHLTRSKRVHHVGFSKSRWYFHIPFNGPADALESRLDPRPLDEILRADGGVRDVLDKGLVPAELVALFCVEGFQGEGGYRLADPVFLKAMRATCDRHGILYVADEVQTFGRTGLPWVHQHLEVTPDIITMAKGAWVGVTLAHGDLEKYLETGWHSNTWGGGKVFDNTMAYTTLETLTEHRDPLFLGRTYLDNERIKGEYLRQRLSELADSHPETVTGFSGLGCMFGLTVRRRAEILDLAWRRGLKLLGAGDAGDEARIRLLFLADVLTHEIDEFIRVLDAVLTEIES